MRFLKSLGFAFNGFKEAFQGEKNFKIHTLLALLAILFGLLFGLTAQEWLWILLAIALVLFAELLNTAIETIVNLVSPDYHLLAKKAKDVAAAAVLITAIFALLTGCIVFFPKIGQWFNGML